MGALRISVGGSTLPPIRNKQIKRDRERERVGFVFGQTIFKWPTMQARCKAIVVFGRSGKVI